MKNAVNAALREGTFGVDTDIDRLKPPSLLLLALELRVISELHAFFAAYPLLRRAPRGDGHPVLVLPGLAASDVSTRPLRTLSEGAGLHGAWLEAGHE